MEKSGLLWVLLLVWLGRCLAEVPANVSNIRIPIDLTIEDAAVHQDKPFRVALITAGGTRSFAVVVESWRRYVLQPFVYVFAHVLAERDNQCPLGNLGIKAIHEVATELEVSYTDIPEELVPIDEDLYTYNRIFCPINQVEPWKKGLRRGNVHDMWSRRSRAYEMAMIFAEINDIKWDLIVFTRIDSAFYSSTAAHPQLPFRAYHQMLMQYRQDTGRRAVVMPSACNYRGYCDRFAAGLPEEMEMYFHRHYINETLDMALQNSTRGRHVEDVLDHCTSSEGLFRGWMFGINDIYQLDTMPLTLRFMTLRTEYIDFYCRNNRHTMEREKRRVRIFETKPLTLELITDEKDYSPEDVSTDPVQRCGDLYSHGLREMCHLSACGCEIMHS